MIDIHRVTHILCIQLLSLKISIYNETITLSMPQVYLLPPKVASRFLYYLFTFSLNTQHKIYTLSKFLSTQYSIINYRHLALGLNLK